MGGGDLALSPKRSRTKSPFRVERGYLDSGRDDDSARSAMKFAQNATSGSAADITTAACDGAWCSPELWIGTLVPLRASCRSSFSGASAARGALSSSGILAYAAATAPGFVTPPP